MVEAQQFTSTFGGNTNVTVTTTNFTEQQKKDLQALASTAQGEISISPHDGLVTITSLKGLELFSNFCRTNNIKDKALDKLMGLHNVSNSAFTYESSGDALAFLNRFSERDVEKMSFSELMTFMMMMVFSSESERRHTLAQIRGTQTEIMLKNAIMEWGQKREAAEKNYDAAIFRAIGEITSGIGQMATSFITAGVSAKMASMQKSADAAKNSAERAALTRDSVKNRTEIEKNEAKMKGVDEKIAKTKEIALKNEKKITENEGRIKDLEAKQVETAGEIEGVKKAKENFDQTEDGGDNYEARQDFKTQIETLEAKQVETAKKIESLKQENEKLAGGLTSLQKTKGKLNDEKQILEGQKESINARAGKMGMTQEDLEAEAKKIAGPTYDAKKVDDNVQKLKDEADMLAAKVRNMGDRMESFRAIGTMAGSTIKGTLDAIGATDERQARLIKAELGLVVAYQQAIGNFSQGVSESISSANSHMNKIIDELKQIISAINDTKMTIARNI